MFWNKEEQKRNEMSQVLPSFVPPPPRKKQFATMQELLYDAEKYDHRGEKDVSDSILTNLCEFIENYQTGFYKETK